VDIEVGEGWGRCVVTDRKDYRKCITPKGGPVPDIKDEGEGKYPRGSVKKRRGELTETFINSCGGSGKRKTTKEKHFVMKLMKKGGRNPGKGGRRLFVVIKNSLV